MASMVPLLEFRRLIMRSVGKNASSSYWSKAAESQLQHKCIKKLDELGIFSVKIITANKRGVPDLICCYKGQFIAIEFKRPDSVGFRQWGYKVKSAVSEIQKAQGALIQKNGGKFYVVSNEQEFLEVLRSLRIERT